MEIHIEKGAERDCAALERLYDELNDYLAEHINYPGWRKGFYPTLEDARAGAEEGGLYVARAEGRIAGTFILRRAPVPGYEQADWGCELDYGDIFVVHTFAVHPDFFRLGLGEQMLRYIIDLAARSGMKAIRLDVNANNVPAIGLYEKCGFKYAGSVDLGYAEYGIYMYRLYQLLL